jgi:hypothetical protein
LLKQITYDANRGDNLEKFVREYAPTTENDTEAYVKHMLRELGVSRTDSLANIIKLKGIGAVAEAISKKEDINYYNNFVKPFLAKL